MTATGKKDTSCGILSHALFDAYSCVSVVTYTDVVTGSTATPIVAVSAMGADAWPSGIVNQMASAVSHVPTPSVPLNMPRCTVLPSPAPRVAQNMRLPLKPVEGVGVSVYANAQGGGGAVQRERAHAACRRHDAPVTSVEKYAATLESFSGGDGDWEP